MFCMDSAGAKNCCFFAKPGDKDLLATRRPDFGTKANLCQKLYVVLCSQLLPSKLGCEGRGWLCEPRLCACAVNMMAQKTINSFLGKRASSSRSIY